MIRQPDLLLDDDYTDTPFRCVDSVHLTMVVMEAEILQPLHATWLLWLGGEWFDNQ